MVKHYNINYGTETGPLPGLYSSPRGQNANRGKAEADNKLLSKFTEPFSDGRYIVSQHGGRNCVQSSLR